MKATLLDLAYEAREAIDRVGLICLRKPRREEVRVVRGICKVCGKEHKLGLGQPRCTAPKAVVSISQGNPAHAFVFDQRSGFGKSGWTTPTLSVVLLALCLAVTGCTGRSHYYFSGAYVGVEQVADGKEVLAGVTITPNPYAYKAVVPVQK